MARLKQVRPQIKLAGSAIRQLAPRQQQAVWSRDNPDEVAFRKTARWQRLRMDVLVRDLFTCQWPGCGRNWMADTSQLVADHILPVRVRPDLKWEESNLRCLCKTCHDGPRQAQERAIFG